MRTVMDAVGMVTMPHRADEGSSWASNLVDTMFSEVSLDPPPPPTVNPGPPFGTVHHTSSIEYDTQPSTSTPEPSVTAPRSHSVRVRPNFSVGGSSSSSNTAVSISHNNSNSTSRAMTRDPNRSPNDLAGILRVLDQRPRPNYRAPLHK